MLSALPSCENEVSPLLNPLRSVSALALIASYFVVRRIIVAQSTTGEAVGRRGSSQDGTDVTAHAVVAETDKCLLARPVPRRQGSFEGSGDRRE